MTDAHPPAHFLRPGLRVSVIVVVAALLGLMRMIFGTAGGADRFRLLRLLTGGGP